MTRSLSRLRNLGPKSAQWLSEVGIDDERTLRDLGPVVAYQMVRHRRPDVSLNLLWALDGAVNDVDWRGLSDDRKQTLLRQLEA